MLAELCARRPRFCATLMALCLALGACLAPAPHAHAQEDGEQDRKQRAGEFFALGVKRFEAGNYQEALSAFERAYRLAPHHAVRVNMAACFAKLGRPVEALFNYERFLHESEGNVSPPQKREVEEAMAELESQVGEVQLNVRPDSARVLIDGREPRPMPDGRLVLATGAYPVEVFAPGHTSYRGLLQVKGGEPSVLQVTLPPSRASSPTPAPGAPGEEGPWSSFESTPSYVDQPTWARAPTRLWIAATGLSFLVGSVVSGALVAKANNDREAALARSMDPSIGAAARVDALLDADQAQGRADTARATTLVLVSAGLSLEASAMVLWLLARKRVAEGDSAQLTPVVAPGYAGLSLSGTL